MIVDDLRIVGRAGACELSARVRDTRLAAEGERAWYRVPAGLAPREADASPYLPALLLAAMALDEPLAIDGPVSARLLAAADHAKEVYRRLYPTLADVRVEAEAHEPVPAGSSVACFFTRGADSWYSVLNGRPGAARARTPPISKLLYSPTADYFAGRPPPSRVRALRAEAAALTREAAERVGCELVVVDTNIRQLVEPHRDWSYSHGALLASMGLALGSDLARVHIAGSLPLGNLVPLGSHPDLDPLWSTERTEVVHDSPEVTRVQKLRFLASHPVALERLKVCINQSAAANCGVCGKCLRTMIGLRLAGAPDGAVSFDRPLRLHRIARLVPRYRLEWAFHRELTGELERAGGEAMIQAALGVAEAQARLSTLGRRARGRLRGA